MAMFRVATLFSVVLLAFVVKNVAGVRGPSQAATAMVETEVTSFGKDGCEKYVAKRDEDDEEFCKCPQDRPRRTKECGGVGDYFLPDLAEPGCRCVSEAELQELLHLPVAAAALRFCEALVEHGRHEAVGHPEFMKSTMRDALKKTSPEICQHALTGTISKTEAEEFPWAENASNLSHKGSAEDDEDDKNRDEKGDLASKLSQKGRFRRFIGRFFKGNDEDDKNRDEKYGRMQPVKESAATSDEKDLWEHALARVCKDECEDLLKMMKNKTEDLTDDVVYDQVPFAQSCAERVVHQVEGEILGCCGRSCGFNGRTCLLWPFFLQRRKSIGRWSVAGK